MRRESPTATINELRKFGLLVGSVFSVIGSWPLVFREQDPRWWAMALGVALIVSGAVVPTSLRSIYAAWMKMGHILGTINTRIILGLIYFGMVTPMGVVMRLFGKDAMHRALLQEARTYRVVRSPRPRHHMRNQF
jgi:hypothetical protein